MVKLPLRASKGVLIGGGLLAIFLFNLIAVQFHEGSRDTMNLLYKEYYSGYKSVDDFRVHNLYKKNDLRYRLAKHFPYEKTSTEQVQRNIWQMWSTNKVETLDEGLQKLIKTFQKQKDESKGSFQHTIVQNHEFVQTVNRTFFDTVPEIPLAISKLPHIILQSDFIRYLMVFAYGGVYSDIDTELGSDLLNWITYNETVYGQPNSVGAIVGIESDRDEKNWDRNGMARRLQWCQWTLQGKRGHPMYRELVARITELTLNHYDEEKQILTIGDKVYNLHPSEPTRFAGILEWTGPGQFTDVVFDYINEVFLWSQELFAVDFVKDKVVDPNKPLNLYSKVKYQRLHHAVHNDYDPVIRPLGWQNFTKLEHPVLLDDDVLLLPHRYFGGKVGERDDYTQHHFKGSWKKG